MKTRTNNPTSPTIGVEEAAEILRCGLPAVQKLIDTGELPALRLNQRHWVLLRDEVIEFVRVKAREQAKVRKIEHARRNAPRPPVPAPPRKPGEVRRRKPLPVLEDDPITVGALGIANGYGWVVE
jgi:excisionase family DNA binding protein